MSGQERSSTTCVASTHKQVPRWTAREIRAHTSANTSATQAPSAHSTRTYLVHSPACSRKGSFFYVIDAFVASIIFIAALIIITSQFASAPASKQAFYSAEDFLSTMEGTRTGAYDSQLIRDWLANGTVTTPSRPILQQLVLFNLTGQTPQQLELAQLMVANVPSNVGAAIYLDGQLVVQRDIAYITESSADQLLTGRRIVLVRTSPSQQFPPVIIEVRTWQ